MISFIIPCYNEEAYIRDCIVSIKQEAGSIAHEIIVVDNNCTDDTAKIAKKEGATVVVEKRKGVVFARQKGYELAKYNLIANIDADSRLSKGWIQTALKSFSDSEVVAVTGPLIYDDVSKTVKLMTKVYYYVAWFSNNYIGVFVQGGNCLIRKDILDKIDGYDTSIVFYGEDTMTAKRLQQFGKIKFVMNLQIHSSPRRIKEQGLIRTSWLYIKNYFSVTFRNKSATNDYKDFR